MVQELFQNDYSMLYRFRSPAFLGRHNINSTDFRLADSCLDLLCHYRVAFPMVVLHGEVTKISVSHPSFQGPETLSSSQDKYSAEPSAIGRAMNSGTS